MKHLIWVFLVLLWAGCAAPPDVIKIKGSDTEVNLVVQLAEAFHEVRPDIHISVSGGGSGLGIASLLNGTTDVANSSRSIKPSELAMLEQRGVPIDSFIFAQDAIAFIVSDQVPLETVDLADLANILSGRSTHWSEYGGPAQRITVYGRQSNSGTYEYVRERLGISFTPRAKQMNGNAQILEAVRADRSGMGYVGAGYVIHGGVSGIRVLTVCTTPDAAPTSPLDTAVIRAGNYYFQRPLFQYYPAGLRQRIQPFLDFEQSELGQRIIAEAGYYPTK